MGYPNKLLVDCFYRYKNKYILIKRKSKEKWFPNHYSSIWRQARPKRSPYQELKLLHKELGVKVLDTKLKAVANNVFHDLKKTFVVFLFIVDLEEMPKLKNIPEASKMFLMTKSEMMKSKQVLEEYKKVFQKIKKGDVIFYHTEYDKDKLLDMKFLDMGF